ncbi:Pr6Pr family membrane protein [Niabella beijingensis]|uniref:Pr6Pr family membrane protein n=1 Tax=Niabella beijingensis TaxID=2872700 RepID=UPI001CC16B38|nr:Pr6Pr family membrane protein [Niabella beijingensis]MBZ4189232.1 Pr6Pr family membrane protein [Niabella beijingensis]
MNSNTTKRWLVVVIAIVAWFAVILQGYLMFLNTKNPPGETLLRFFSYYTILTNILVAVYCTVLLIRPGGRTGTFFLRPGPATAVAVYITIVGLVYNLVLRQLWNPGGWQWLVDELLHVGVPLLFILYWLIAVPKSGLRYKGISAWLIYPAVYAVCIFLRGAQSGFYPYPFVDVVSLGYQRALLNSIVLAGGFLLMSAAFIALGRLLSGGGR